MNINKAILWNEEVGNKRGEFDYHLESKMLNEELMETFNAMQQNDKTEVIDGLIDVIFVAVGSMHKFGLTEDQIKNAWDSVCESNNTKLPFEKDEDGKVKKNKNFVAPDFSKIVSTL